MDDYYKGYNKFFEEEGYSQTFSKKDAGILWNTEKGRITDLLVEEFKDNSSKQYLHKSYSYSLGKWDEYWEDFDLSDVLIKIFVSYQIPLNRRKHILLELSRVSEWRPKLAKWLYNNWGKK
jgi:hypothetical protein